MSLLSRLKRPGPSGFGYASTAEEVTRGLDLSGKTYLLTGCNSGLGRETLRVLASRGARVVATARSLDKAREACSTVSGDSRALACDLSEPTSVRACAAELTRDGTPLDAIICNAGIMALPRLTRAHGYEAQFFTNHIGHFLLVVTLLPLLAHEGRVVVVSSDAHRRAPSGGIQLDNLSGERGYHPWTAYGQSKLANLLFARELARRLPRPRQSANALHPGVIATNLARNMPLTARVALRVLEPLALKSTAQGAATQCYVATTPGLSANGAYFSHSNVATSSRLGQDLGLARRLWEASERIVEKL
ncbi:MAG TPA: SDR family NAD(P)-dependent oxidoreductase [Polyangiaceae bacterium]|nr:SDR family NAD(P)-dependent oxidoreductase [Polyangiaceae bacterium]